VGRAAAGGASLVDDAAMQAVSWLGKDARVITNKAGDKVFMSSDGARKMRFDLNRPHPHTSPHVHIEELVNGKWIGPRIFPKGVPQH
jgi:hypothetical protein